MERDVSHLAPGLIRMDPGFELGTNKREDVLSVYKFERVVHVYTSPHREILSRFVATTFRSRLTLSFPPMNKTTKKTLVLN